MPGYSDLRGSRGYGDGANDYAVAFGRGSFENRLTVDEDRGEWCGRG